MLSEDAELKQLWHGKVPPLTPEQKELAIQLWHKIQARKQRQSNRDSELMPD